ncbi:hypothetical protein HDU67_004998 [Dinochytrium kinnereticum]|nr:hypothetical protein HDU67_004998 [Dinochytrium kinnereticum]
MAVFESGAILLYLAEHYDPQHKILSTDPKKKSEAIQWLMWQMGGLGPMQGQLTHYNVYATEKVPYAIKRYTDETMRLYKTLERNLADGRMYVAGDFSLADISMVGWVAYHNKSGISLAETPLVKKWFLRMLERPATLEMLTVFASADVPTPTTFWEEVKAKLQA